MIEKLNYKHNKNIILEGKTLNGQGVGNLAKCRYGLFPMSYNGCEIIAVYNFRQLLGIPAPLCDVAKEIYPYGNAIMGLFGTVPQALKKYFKDNNISVFKENNFYKFRNTFETKKYGIISFWNANNIFHGLHTVAIEKTPDGIKVYNKSNKASNPVVYKSLDYYIDADRFICGYYHN
jgi:hypothetical protein